MKNPAVEPSTAVGVTGPMVTGKRALSKREGMSQNGSSGDWAGAGPVTGARPGLLCRDWGEGRVRGPVSLLQEAEL